jgi:hypothetical protein
MLREELGVLPLQPLARRDVVDVHDRTPSEDDGRGRE